MASDSATFSVHNPPKPLQICTYIHTYTLESIDGNSSSYAYASRPFNGTAINLSPITATNYLPIFVHVRQIKAFNGRLCVRSLLPSGSTNNKKNDFKTIELDCCVITIEKSSRGSFSKNILITS